MRRGEGAIPSREIGKLPLINALDSRVGLSGKYGKKERKAKKRKISTCVSEWKGIHTVAIIARAFSNERADGRREIKLKKLRDRGRSRWEDGARGREGEREKKAVGKKEEERKARNFNAHKSRKLLSGHYRSPIHALAREPCRTRARLPVCG